MENCEVAGIKVHIVDEMRKLDNPEYIVVNEGDHKVYLVWPKERSLFICDDCGYLFITS